MALSNHSYLVLLDSGRNSASITRDRARGTKQIALTFSNRSNPNAQKEHVTLN